MNTAQYERVWYPASTYVWCKGTSNRLGKHPVFVSSPVKFTHAPDGRFTLQTCGERTCSLYGQGIRYEDSDIGLQDGYVRRIPTRSKQNER